MLPEVYRYARSELRPARLWSGLGAITLLCLTLSLAVNESGKGSDLFPVYINIQALILLLYGTQRTAASVSSERSERTWDFQRLTPLSSGNLAAGKLLGAPIYAYFLAAVILPWTGWSLFLSEGGDAYGRIWAFLLLAALSFLVLAAGLMVSAFSETHDSGTVNVGGGMVGFVGISFYFSYLAAMDSRIRGHHEVVFFGLTVGNAAFGFFSSLAFGAWALAAAKWRIARDLLEPRRLWRLPAFLIFVAWYALGLTVGAGGKVRDLGLSSALLLPVLFLYIAAMINRESAEHWKLWVSEPEGRADRTPVWLAGWATVLAISLVLAVMAPGLPILRLLIIIPAFLGRDLCFLQWCRFTQSRQPEQMALVYIALGYIIPPILVGAFAPYGNLYYWVVPAVSERVSFLGNVLPSLLHLGIMGVILRARLVAILDH